jgi:hypothetical protein
MPDLKISELPASDALTGVELVELVQGGVNKRTTTQDIADLGGGGSVTSVSGTTDRITSTGGATPVIDISATFEALLQKLVNAATALTDAASMDLTAIKHTLTTSSATRTFTISYTGDDITLIVTLNATTSTFTFPATSLCVSEGVATGDNTCPLAGVSGDQYAIAIKKVGSAYYVVCKNFGQ